MMPAWTLLPARAGFAAHAREWDVLCSELAGGHPALDSRCVDAQLRNHAGDREVLCLGRIDDRLVAALVLTQASATRWHSFRRAQAPLAPVLLPEMAWLDALFARLPGGARSIDLVAVDARFAPTARGACPPFAVAESERAGVLDRSAPAVAGDDADEGMCRLATTVAERLAATTPRSLTARPGEFHGAPGDRDVGELWQVFAVTGEARAIDLQGPDGPVGRALVLRTATHAVLIDLALAGAGKASASELRSLELGPAIAQLPDRPLPSAPDWRVVDRPIVDLRIFRNEAVAGIAVANPFARPIAPQRPAVVDAEALPAIGSFAARGIDLAPFATRPDFELTPDWFDLTHRHVYAGSDDTRYYCGGRPGAPDVILPVRRTRAGPVRQIEALGSCYTSICYPLTRGAADPGALQAALALASRDHDAQVLKFGPMDPEAAGYHALLATLRAAGWVPFSYFGFGNWYLRVEGDWNHYLKTRTAAHRSNIKRANKKFEGAGGTVEIATRPDEVARAMDAYLRVYSASWKVPEPYPDFIPALVRRLAELGGLRLGTAWLGGEPIAAQIWIVSGGKASIFKVGYHEAFAEYSPGTVVTALLMQHVIEQDRVGEVDFLMGDDKYKRIWMDHRRERVAIVAYNARSFVGTLLLLAKAARRTAKAALARIRSQDAPGANAGSKNND